ncbi:PLP-dependent transferase [Dichomitus squalens]|uniref:PLP-dependent transferase n=1 Tax=Dichomitus squalens TaxID=114155 RepID=A0A4Q9PMT6_9APHY|nr:PLP-dependent transferase [Dichomitus squalens]
MPIPKLTPGPGETYDASQKPPPFGHPLKAYFALDEDYVNLNHGSYGSLPLPLIFKINELSYEIERNPDKFHRLTFRPEVERSREAVAKLVGAEADEIVLVPNATHALNVVLRNFEWRDGDVLIGASTTYGAVANTIKYLADRSEGPRPDAASVEYNFPLTHTQIVDIFRAKIREVKQQYPESRFTDIPALSPGFTEDPAGKKNKLVAVIDSITANPGALMPWKQMVRVAHEEGVWTVIDAAHSIGQEPNINLTETKPDFWLSNAHKWLYAKRGCAVLYTPRRNQYIIKSSIPTSHEYISPKDPQYEIKGTNYVNQHIWTGTSDLSQAVTVTEAIAFREWLGGEKAIYDHCHKVAVDGAKKLAEVLGTRVIDESGELTATMSNVQLPLPTKDEKPINLEIYLEVDAYLKDQLLNKWKTYAAHFYHNGAWWVRCSAQVYNEVSDFEYLGKALNAVCREVKDTILSKY